MKLFAGQFARPALAWVLSSCLVPAIVGSELTQYDDWEDFDPGTALVDANMPGWRIQNAQVEACNGNCITVNVFEENMLEVVKDDDGPGGKPPARAGSNYVRAIRRQGDESSRGGCPKARNELSGHMQFRAAANEHIWFGFSVFVPAVPPTNQTAPSGMIITLSQVKNSDDGGGGNRGGLALKLDSAGQNPVVIFERGGMTETDAIPDVIGKWIDVVHHTHFVPSNREATFGRPKPTEVWIRVEGEQDWRYFSNPSMSFGTESGLYVKIGQYAGPGIPGTEAQVTYFDELRLLMAGQDDGNYFDLVKPGQAGEAWAGFPVSSAGDVDTSDWMGYLNVQSAPWLWSYSLSKYLYLEEDWVTGAGSWLYALN